MCVVGHKGRPGQGHKLALPNADIGVCAIYSSGAAQGACCCSEDSPSAEGRVDVAPGESRPGKCLGVAQSGFMRA